MSVLRFDYDNQAWVRDGKYVRCGHTDQGCGCYGRTHEGEIAPPEVRQPCPNCDRGRARDGSTCFCQAR